MNVAEIITPRTGTGVSGDPYRPQLADDYVLSKWEDVTGQPSANFPTDPDLYIIRPEMTDAVLADIEADATYEVLWSEVLPPAL